MRFLMFLFVIVVTILATLFGYANWVPVDLVIGDIIVTSKLSFVLLIAFLLGLVPTLFYHWKRIWSLRRRLDGRGQVHVANAPPVVPPRPVPAANMPDRTATDAKAWPAE